MKPLLEEGDAEALSLTLYLSDWGRSLLTQTGGQLIVEAAVNLFDGEYRTTGGNLTADSLSVAWSGENLNAFFIDLTGVPKPDPPCVPDPPEICVPDIRFFYPAVFELGGGTVQVAEQLAVGRGLFNVYGGRLDAGSLLLDAGGSSQIPIDSRRFALGEIAHGGGIIAIEGETRIQDGRFAVSGGELTTQRLEMGDPILVPSGDSNHRSPVFIQTGGAVKILESLEMCAPNILPPVQESPLEPFSAVIYELDAGRLTVGGDTVVGSLGAAPARFLQSGGTHRTAGTLRIEGAESIYDVSGGELHVGALEVGTGVFNEGGTRSLAAGANVTVDSRITLGARAELRAAPGSQIHFAGGDVEIVGHDPELLAGLDNLSLLVAGGYQAELEAAAADLGGRADGFDGNFSFHELIVGAAGAIGRLLLVDNYVNQAHASAEAVYVDRLEVAAGSTLALGGLTLYYREAEILGDVIPSGGALVAVVPEPATIVAVALVAGVIGCRRQRVISRARC